MENLETFFSSENYDAKNITNKSQFAISQDIVNNIESGKVTIEDLEKIGTKIFKYKTQITIHGLFPEINKRYIGGYQNLIQNKNLSIGVKWAAVDYHKKEIIYTTIKNFCKDWHTAKSSTYFHLYRTSPYFSTRDDYKKYLAEFNEIASKIDKSLFFGDCTVFLSQSYYGYFLVLKLNINAVYQKNVDLIIENVLQTPYDKIVETIQENKRIEEEDRKNREIERLKNAEIEKEKRAPVIHQAKEFLRFAGYEFVEKFPIYNGLEVVSIKISEDYEPRFEFTKYYKTDRQKLFRKERSEEQKGLSKPKYLSYTKNETIQKIVSGWIKK